VLAARTVKSNASDAAGAMSSSEQTVLSFQFQGEPLQQGHKIHWGGNILRFSTEIAVYLGNGTR